ncbi:tetratricopeptide repeat protein [Sphingobacterium sp. UT-1RO-CII-1]|uniref:tetratricopeptide repeat protein n=1 Tax=Sphingobacterium sp. UT-1RO-CII-1 TaxID=2995225 RepID=UPI00227BD8CD|nr:tetratricopeptide repeat protein [Sphingobacterium sp. UT-1RO-CII-1]MCY4779905.1 tetratricopeptide repeat protein [Sphingobacterium sp. UT-1RO-CII-1]
MSLSKKIFYIGITVLLFLSVHGNAQEVVEEKPYKNELMLAEGQLRTGNLIGAIDILDGIIEKYPDAAEVYYAKALLFGQARNFEMAVPLAVKAYELEQTNILYANYLIELYKGSGDLLAAINVLDKVILDNPNNAALMREKMMLLHASKQSEEALEIYDISVNKFGASDTLDVIKAEILGDLQRKDEALTVLKPWADNKSRIRQVYSAMAYIYISEKNVKQAIQILEKGVENTKDDLLYLDLADAYAAGKRNKQAFEVLNKAFESSNIDYGDKHRVMFTILSGRTDVTLEQMQQLANVLVLKYPRIADSHVAKGDVMWRQGKLAEGRALFLTAVGLNANHVDAWRMLMNVELAMNESQSAIAHGFEALNANPNNVMLLYFTGIAYIVHDDMDNARKMLERALDNSSTENAYLQSLIYAGLGDVYHKLKQAAVSDVAYEEAIKLDSTNATAMNNYAYYLSERNEKLELAEKLSKQSNELDPESGTFQDTYAWVLFKQEKYKEALVWIEKAVRSSKPSAVLYEHYGDILFKTGSSKEAVKQWEKALALNNSEEVDMERLKKKITDRNYVE